MAGGNTAITKTQTGKPSLALLCSIDVAGHNFSGVIGDVAGSVAIGADWTADEHSNLSFRTLAENLGINYLPDVGVLELELSKAGIAYCAGSIIIEVKMASGESVSLAGGASYYSLKLLFGAEGKMLLFSEMPVLGGVLPVSDYILLKKLAVTYSNSNLLFEVIGELSMFGQKLSFPPDEKDSSAPVRDPVTSQVVKTTEEEKEDGIKWFEINKTVSIMRIGRIGVSYKNEEIKLYFDAGFSVSIFTVEFLGLRIGTSLKKGGFDFGLDGLVVSLDKPPLSVTGGLYNAGKSGEVLYNGLLKVQFKDIALTAIGSYGEVTDKKTGKKTPSLFIYAALLMPMGGPPYFYITGVALGFGINRAIKMPLLQEVPKFPLVQVIMGTGQLKPDDTPGKALSTLSSHIKPSPGDYFATVGIKFTSFSIAASFALLIVEFGSRIRITLLGQSVISMPPNTTKKQRPMMYAELAIRAVFDFETGYFEALGALTNESYVLDYNCKLQGGFAVAVWTKGERAGDFIVTLGGCHHPMFASKKSQYPSVEKVGVNWAITNELSLKGLAYYAVTQSCAMAGCDISINYASGNFKAWMTAQASFYMLWKPFHYDIDVRISVGASYTFSIMGWEQTLKVQLGASLHLWGPEFSGSVKISLSVITVTVNFGAGASSAPPISWNEFRNGFLQKEPPKEHGQQFLTDGGALPTCAIKFTGGKTAEGADTSNNDTVFIIPPDLKISIQSEIPSSKVIQGEKTIADDKHIPGIAPMNKQKVQCTLSVTIERSDNRPVSSDALEFTVLRGNKSAALWGVNPGPSSGLIKNIITGVEIKPRSSKLTGTLPRYDIKNLVDWILREGSGFSAADMLSAKPDTEEKPFETLKSKDNLKRNANVLREAFPHLQMPRHTDNGIYDNPMDYFWATPQIRKTGVKLRNG